MRISPISYNCKTLSTPAFSGNLSCQSIKDLPKEDTLSLSFASQDVAVSYKEQGNQFFKKDEYAKAVDFYLKAIEEKPDYEDAYYNLAKCYKGLNDVPQAITTYKKLIELSPENVEYLSNLAEILKDNKNYKDSYEYYEKALAIDPKFDVANRGKLELENIALQEKAPDLAEMRKKQQSLKNLNASLDLVKAYYPQEVMDRVSDIKFMFDDTASLNGHKNLAQYENYNNRIVIGDKYLWAAPEVVAAYMVHEVIHGRDKDPYTSIREEQDAYEESIKFWSRFNNGVKDAELDYAKDLYAQSPATLSNKVAEIYSTREKTIPQYSPNHGIATQGFDNLMFRTKKLFSNMVSGSKDLGIIAEDPLYAKYCK